MLKFCTSVKQRVLKFTSLILIPIVFPYLILPTQLLYALPSGYSVESGEVSFDNTSDPSILTITASDQAIINFDSFSIAQNEMVQFIQSSDTSSVLSRVT